MEKAEQEGVSEMNVDEEVPESTGELNIAKLKDLMVKVNGQFDNNATNIMDFTETYFEWTKMFYHLGKALAVAFKGKS